MGEGHKRRWRQFRLRTLIAAVTVAAVLCAAGAPWAKRYFEQKSDDNFDQLIRQIEETVKKDPWTRDDIEPFPEVLKIMPEDNPSAKEETNE